ncbi:hypothetical protein UPYG_G00114670 [Umbra pygmaea]|uniref:Uncharacterized protein n=1 Tax=Umbra pygmaea TaxID=75934 RepID=A0ABD0XR21_UMBPY
MLSLRMRMERYPVFVILLNNLCRRDSPKHYQNFAVPETSFKSVLVLQGLQENGEEWEDKSWGGVVKRPEDLCELPRPSLLSPVEVKGRFDSLQLLVPY